MSTWARQPPCVPTSKSVASRRAQVHGLGLIGGSLGLALRSAGWDVSGYDVNPSRRAEALELGVVDDLHLDRPSDVAFVAAPAAVLPSAVLFALSRTDGCVTDVGSVKSGVCSAVGDGRFVGGHPMAGSEQVGLRGARADMFDGAVWVLTPAESTSDEAYATVRSVVGELGAETVTMPADVHDSLVAVVSHVPHLTAATLMRLADERGTERAVLKRLAAGGFRDMTRIAAGNSDIWLDICEANRSAITSCLDRLIGALGEMRSAVEGGDRGKLSELLEQARRARTNLPVGAPADSDLVELRVPIPDRPGEVARIATLAGQLDVNIYDLEIAHSPEGDLGVMILVIPVEKVEVLRAALADGGYSPALGSLPG